MERTKQLHIFINPELHKKLKMEAARQGRSITDLLEELIETELEKIQKRYVYLKNSKIRRIYFFCP